MHSKQIAVEYLAPKINDPSMIFKDINIFKSITVIGLITFVISFSGVYLGSKIGKHINAKAEYLGGAILIIIAFKTLFF